MNLGGPDSQQAVRPFLYNLFSDREIIRLGPAFMQKPIAWMIAKTRAPKTQSLYRLIGGASPILEITNAQGAALQTRLREHGDFRVTTGMRYWQPFIKDAVDQAASEGITRLMALSLYPHYSKATTGSSERAFLEALAAHPQIERASVAPWYDHQLYISALADTLKQALQPNSHVLFSAHSLPVSFIEEGDPYVEHIQATIACLAKLMDFRWSFGYQSRSGPVKWLEPSTEQEIERLAREGVRDILVVPISFVSDHIETLYEVDILYKGLAQSHGATLRRTQSLNTHPIFIRCLEDLVLKKARELSWA